MPIKSLVTPKKAVFPHIAVLSVLSAGVLVGCLCIGRYQISLAELFEIIRYGDTGNHSSAYNVLMHIRFPRVFLAYLIGVALSVSGAAYQSMFNNRLISPGVLGVNAGACVGAGICILCGIGAVGTTLAAFSCGIGSAVLALLIQKVSKKNSSLVLVLAGVIVSALMNSLIGIIKYLADGENKLASITFWMLGDISGAELRHVVYIFPFVAICSGVLYMMGWRLNAIALGERDALSLGIDYVKARIAIIGCATLLTSVSVSISGSIDWVGLIIPNVARSLVGSDNQRMIPVTILLGGIFMTVVDTIARTVAPSEIPLGIITGLLGAATYFAIIVRKRGAI